MAFEYQGFATLGVNLNRQKYGPLDISNVFTSEADLNYYLSKGAITEGVSTYWYKDDVNKVVPYPYEGQVLATVIDGDVNVYVLRLKADGSFEAKAIEPDVDGKTIKLTNGKLELVGLPTNTAGKTYVPSFVNGTLTWAEPDTTTTDNLGALIDALDDDMTAVENRATELEKTVDGYGEGESHVKGLVEKLADEVAARTQADSDLAGDIADALQEAKGYAKEYADNIDKALKAADEALEARVDALEDTADDHEDRLVKVEAFFGTNADDENKGFEHLDAALDTLVEIQTFLNGEGGAVKDIIDDIAANAEAIDELEAEFAEGGRVTAVETLAADNEARLDAVESDVDVLQSISKSYLTAGEDAIKKDVDEAQRTADAAVAAIGAASADGKAATGAYAAIEAAQKAADDAQADVDALKKVVVGEDEKGGVKALAEDNATRLDSVEADVEQAEKDIDALEAIVKNGDDTNAKLRESITSLQNVVEKGDDANSKLRSDLTDLTGRVSTAEGTLATTTTTANNALAKAEAAQEDLDKAEEAIEALQNVVEKGDNTNAKLREAITAIQGIVETGADNNEALGKEIDAVVAKVDNTTTGLVATKDIADRAETKADSNAAAIEAIEGDYMRIGADSKLYTGKAGADVIVFNCGTAKTNI